MAKSVKFVDVDAADRSKFATQKSSFQRSRFSNGMVLEIIGYGFAHREENGVVDRDHGYPVLKTAINGHPFDDIFISTLVRPDVDVDFNEIPKSGTFNKIAIEADVASATDEAWMQKIVADLAGRRIKVVRKVPVVDGKKVRTEVYGREQNLNQLNFDVVE